MTPAFLSVPPNFDHPAKYNTDIMKVLEEICVRYEMSVVYDPFGGIGGIHDLPVSTFCSELEPEWAHAAATRGPSACLDFFNIEGQGGLKDSLFYTVNDDNVDTVSGLIPNAIVTSPTYGNRMADKHTQGPADKSKRLTYKHRLGRNLSDNNSGGIQWGDAYRRFHCKAWEHAYDLLRPGGYLVVNVKDHYRSRVLQSVSLWHERACVNIGFKLLGHETVSVRGMGFGQHQTTLKVSHENVFVFQKPI